jgi:hypothetical protein
MKDRIYAWVPRERMTLRLLASCVQGDLRSCRVRDDGAMLLKWAAEHRDLVVRSGLVPMSLDEVSRDMTAEQERLGEGREAWQGRVAPESESPVVGDARPGVGDARPGVGDARPVFVMPTVDRLDASVDAQIVRAKLARLAEAVVIDVESEEGGQ